MNTAVSPCSSLLGRFTRRDSHETSCVSKSQSSRKFQSIFAQIIRFKIELIKSTCDNHVLLYFEPQLKKIATEGKSHD